MCLSLKEAALGPLICARAQCWESCVINQMRPRRLLLCSIYQLHSSLLLKGVASGLLTC